jgi:hypothetical protein
VWEGGRCLSTPPTADLFACLSAYLRTDGVLAVAQEGGRKAHGQQPSMDACPGPCASRASTRLPRVIQVKPS